MNLKSLFWIVGFFLLAQAANAALTGNEINALVDSAILLAYDNLDVDNSTVANSGVNTAALLSTESSSCVAGQCMYFPDNSNIVYSNVAQYQTTNNFTISWWTNASVGDRMLGRHTATTAGHWLAGDGGLAADDIFFRIYEAAGSNNFNCNNQVILNAWTMVTVVANGTGAGGSGDMTMYLNGTFCSKGTITTAGTLDGISVDLWLGDTEASNGVENMVGGLDEVYWFNKTLTNDEITYIFDENLAGRHLVNVTADAPSPPNILTYNLSSDGGEGCDNWDTNKNNACVTADTTPTVKITTDEDANCAIGIYDYNYTDLIALGGDRECSGGGSQALTCTVVPADELTEDRFIYIGCKDTDGNENLTSTSGALKVELSTSDLESYGRTSMETGIQLALTRDYTIYTDQKIYARNSANNQSVGGFDKVVKWMNKIWAFNFLTGNDTYVGMFNITPVLYTLEMDNITNSTVNTSVYQFIIDTK